MLIPNLNRIVPCEYGNEPDKVHQKVQILYQWLTDNPHINACTDTENLKFFLHSCKYDVDRTKKKIKWYEIPPFFNKFINHFVSIIH